MKNDTKEVPVRGTRYVIGRMTAADGSWITNLVTSNIRKDAAQLPKTTGAAANDDATPPLSPEQKAALAAITPELGLAMTAEYLLSSFNRKEMAEVQLMCMGVCKRIERVGEQDVAMPIVTGEKWEIADLQYDGPTVLELSKECLAFNIAPFFHGAGSTSLT